jgi:DNA topoisomerase III
MSFKLCIAEKPSVAREIANIIGAKTRQDGYLEGNGYRVTWTFGHLCTLKEPDDYNPDWKKWSLNTLPILPDHFETKLIQQKGISQQFNVIKKLCKEANLVINCGDAGQEGELIQRWVLKQAGYKGKVLRLWISSLTPEAIRQGFNHLKNASDFDNLYYAGSSRAIGDWLLGMNATRLYTLRFGGYKQVLSIGRVQTPTLAMLVERHKEIENFVPEPYWELQTVYREVVFNSEKGRFLKKEEGEVVLQQVQGHPFEILSFEKKKGTEHPPSLFDLTSLQVHCNRRFGYTADQTLKIVQSLYENKVVTYPRVDTTYLPNDVYPKVDGILGKMSSYSQFTQPLLGKPIRKSSKVFNDKKVTDHHAIIPTGVQRSLQGNELNVYDAIARQFIAAFYPDCVFAKTTVIGESNGVKFKATGKEILEEGWRVLFPKPKQSQTSSDQQPKNSEGKEEEERILPTFQQGETGEHQPALVEKVTQPPKYYTEATLLRAMETAGKQIDDEELRNLMKANGIGRPATRANIIETLFKRQYIQRKRKLIVPTEVGVQLIDTIQVDLLKSAELTGQWEKQLRDMEDGKYNPKVFIDEMKKMVANLVNEVKHAENIQKIESATPLKTAVVNSTAPTSKTPASKTKNAPKREPKAKPTPNTINKIVGQPCPKCQQGQLLKGKTAYGCSRWKENCSFRLPFEFGEKEIPEKQLLRLLEEGSSVLLSGFKMNGKLEKGKLFLDEDKALQFKIKASPEPKNSVSKTTIQTKAKPAPVQKAADKPTCPKCGVGKVIKGKTAYGCSNWQTGCTFRFSYEEVRKRALGQTLTQALVLRILNG